MNVTYNDNGYLETREHLSPVGKVFTGKIVKKDFFEKYRTYRLKVNEVNTRLRFIDEKLKINIPQEERDEYQKEAMSLMTNQINPPYFDTKKLKSARFRVTSYTEYSTVVKAADKKTQNLLKKMGYDPSEF